MLLYSSIAVWEFFQMHFTAKKKLLVYLQMLLSLAFFLSISTKFIPIEIPFSRYLIINSVSFVIVFTAFFIDKRFFFPAFLALLYIVFPFALTSFFLYGKKATDILNYRYDILLFVFALIWIFDSFAYIFGTLFGKHKIKPSISPKKSWEGLIGGAIICIATAIGYAVFKEADLWKYALVATIIIVFGSLGDFFESFLKRKANVKDSSSILPGHGGILDRFDSFIFIIPVLFIFDLIFNIFVY
jgi:phosphatidate cytidylyltransferase